MLHYIALEGGEYVGKTTLLNGLTKIFPDMFLTREPGGTTVGEKIRTLVREEVSDPHASALLFMAQRQLFCSECIDKMVKEDQLVLTDRSFLTSVIYQPMMGGASHEDIINQNIQLVKYLPNKFIYLYANDEELLRRCAERGEETDILGKFAFANRKIIHEKYMYYLEYLKTNFSGFDYIAIDTSSITSQETLALAETFIKSL